MSLFMKFAAWQSGHIAFWGKGRFKSESEYLTWFYMDALFSYKIKWQEINDKTLTWCIPYIEADTQSVDHNHVFPNEPSSVHSVLVLPQKVVFRPLWFFPTPKSPIITILIFSGVFCRHFITDMLIMGIGFKFPVSLFVIRLQYKSINRFRIVSVYLYCSVIQ